MVTQVVFNERHEVGGDRHRAPARGRLRRAERDPAVSQLHRRFLDLNGLVENLYPVPPQSGQLTEPERAIGRQ